jgi:hypothetical protein
MAEMMVKMTVRGSGVDVLLGVNGIDGWIPCQLSSIDDDDDTGLGVNTGTEQGTDSYGLRTIFVNGKG